MGVAEFLSIIASGVIDHQKLIFHWSRLSQKSTHYCGKIHHITWENDTNSE
jgi:hypothetical protein